ncbi:MAG TPA: hypothetical protein VI451_00250 [Anaerolineales bacterium]|nr:hypothetical protein [Anaerolineales bacterium]
MKTNHLDLDSLTGYIYYTLDDATREGIDVHLLNCPTCRGRLTEQELKQRKISEELNAVIRQATPSNRMSFAAISNRLQIRHPFRLFWGRLVLSTPLALAGVGLLLAVLGLWQFLEVRTLSTPSQQLGTFPTLACFLFMLASVEEFDKTFSIRSRFIITILVAGILWLGSVFIGLLNIIVIRDLAILATVAFGGKAVEAGPVAILAVMVAAMFYIGVVIGGAEYHYRNVGQPNSWKLFSITLLVQLFILILPYLIL